MFFNSIWVPDLALEKNSMGNRGPFGCDLRGDVAGAFFDCGADFGAAQVALCRRLLLAKLG